MKTEVEWRNRVERSVATKALLMRLAGFQAISFELPVYEFTSLQVYWFTKFTGLQVPLNLSPATK